MKQLFTNLALFIVFCIVFSGLSACTGTQSNIANNSSAKPTTKANAQTNDAKTSAYPLLGSGLAEAELEMLDGAKTKISDRKGKVVLVNIWGTWCGPCRAEMPFLIAMQDQYRDRGLEIMGLNIGDGGGTPESVEAIKKFVEQMKLNYTIVRSSNAATAQFYAITKQQVVPQTMLVDRDGHLRGVFIGGGQSIAEAIKTALEKTMAE